MAKQNGNQKLGLESSLGDLAIAISTDRNTGKIKKGMASSMVMGMLWHLSSDEPIRYVPRKIKTIEGLYTVTKDEIRYGFRCYKKKTWLKLNEALELHGLPPIILPQEYTSDQ